MTTNNIKLITFLAKLTRSSPFTNTNTITAGIAIQTPRELDASIANNPTKLESKNIHLIVFLSLKYKKPHKEIKDNRNDSWPK